MRTWVKKIFCFFGDNATDGPVVKSWCFQVMKKNHSRLPYKKKHAFARYTM